MSFIRSISIVNAVLVFSLAACGDKQSTVSSQDKASSDEAMRSMSANISSTAQSLTVLNPKHDKQYFVDRQVAIVKECVSSSDLESCIKPKIEGLRYE